MFRKIELIGVIAFIVFIAGCNVSRNAPEGAAEAVDSGAVEPAQQSGTSRFTSKAESPDCELRVNLLNTTFRVSRLFSRNSPVRNVLVRQQSTQTGCTNSEGLTGTIKLDAWVDRFDAGTKPTWHAEAEGHDGVVDGDFYKITKRGCCGSTDASVYFNLLSGKKVFESTSELVRIEVPNTGNSRYVAFLDTWSILNPEEAKQDRDVIGALQYGPAGGPGERVIVRLKTTNPFSLADLSVAATEKPEEYSKTLELWSANAKESPTAIGGFKIRAQLIEVGGNDRQPTFVIPVSSDHLDLDHAQSTPGIEFRRVP